MAVCIRIIKSSRRRFAESVSYSSAGNILPIIQGKAENKIIHLHGMYDKLHGIDDIIADDPQYGGILTDMGAQFIQNLISTHPIVIIGCGGMLYPRLAGCIFLTNSMNLWEETRSLRS